MRRIAIITEGMTEFYEAVVKSILEREYSKDGIEIILTYRDKEKSKELLKRLKNSNKNAKIVFYELNLQSFESIRRFFVNVKNDFKSIDVLFNGLDLYFSDKKTRTTIESFESVIGTNYIANYYLIMLFKEILEKGQSPQIINICSKYGIFGDFNISENHFENNPSGIQGYQNSKLYQLLMTTYFSEKFKDVGISVNGIDARIYDNDFFDKDTLFNRLKRKLYSRNIDSEKYDISGIVELLTNPEKFNDTGHIFDYELNDIDINLRIKELSIKDELIDSTEKIISSKQSKKEEKKKAR